METTFDFLGIALVSECAKATVSLEIVVEHLGKIDRLLSAQRLKAHVYLAIFPHTEDETLHTVARMHLFKHLILVNQSRISVIHDHLKAQIRLLPHQ